MKHFTKQHFTNRGYQLFFLIDDEGDRVWAFDHFVSTLLQREYAFATIKRYMEVVANFIDYLVETKVFGTAVPAATLNEAIDSYLSIKIRADRVRAAPNDSRDKFICWAKPIVHALGLRSVQLNANLTAPINLFLRGSEVLARTERERVAYLDIRCPPWDYQGVIRSVEGQNSLPAEQKKALKQGSMLANVMRLNPQGLTKPRGLVIPTAHKPPLRQPPP